MCCGNCYIWREGQRGLGSHCRGTQPRTKKKSHSDVLAKNCRPCRSWPSKAVREVGTGRCLNKENVYKIHRQHSSFMRLHFFFKTACISTECRWCWINYKSELSCSSNFVLGSTTSLALLPFLIMLCHYSCYLIIIIIAATTIYWTLTKCQVHLFMTSIYETAVLQTSQLSLIEVKWPCWVYTVRKCQNWDLNHIHLTPKF